MAEKAKHAFGALERVDESIASGKIDAFDVLFVKDANGKPYVGWVDKQGNKVICNENLDANLTEMEAEIATKASKDEVNNKLDAAVLDIIDIANAYTDTQIETKIAEVNSGFEVIEF